MKKLLILLLLPVGLFAQVFDASINTEVQKVSKDSLLKYLQEFENLGIKELGTNALNNTADWIEAYHNSWGYTVQKDVFSAGGNQLVNLIVDIKGTENPEQVFVIDGHYDTKAGPGVSDNGTGTAILLELARILKNNPPKSTVCIIHFSGEEDGLLGSTHYVNNTLTENNTNLFLVLNIDEVGGVAGQLNNTIVCEYDNFSPTVANATSKLMTDTLANLVELYSSLKASKNIAFSSDYIPFQDKEYVITGFYEANQTPYAHTINDSLKYLDADYVTEVAKATVAASLYFKNYNSVVGIYNSELLDDIIMNVENNYLQIANSGKEEIIASVYSINGNLVISQKVETSLSKINISNLSSGIYLLKLANNNGVVQNWKFVKN